MQAENRWLQFEDWRRQGFLIACDPLVMSLRDAEDLARDLMALKEADMEPIWDAYWRNPA